MSMEQFQVDRVEKKMFVEIAIGILRNIWGLVTVHPPHQEAGE